VTKQRRDSDYLSPCFAAVLAIGGYNRYWLVPQVSDSTARDGRLRNVGVESVILLFAVWDWLLFWPIHLRLTDPAATPGTQ
jgi:hypothetical protein